MSPSIALHWNEQILIQEICMRLQGPLAYSGVLTVTDQRLFFHPTGRLDRMVGVKNFESAVDSIETMEIKGLDRNVVLKIQEEQVRFTGDGAHRVYARLDSMLKEGGEQAHEAVFEPGEQVLIQGAAAIYPNGLIATRGEVTLTDRRIRFEPGRGLETLIWKFQPVDEPLSWIQGIRLSQVQRMLKIVGEGRNLHLGGKLVPAIYSRLKALGIAEEDETSIRTIGTRRSLESWSASHIRGLLQHPGTLAAGPRNLNFTPKSRLDAVGGARAVTIPLASVTQMEVLGWADKKLIILAGEDRHVFTMEEPEKRVHELAPMLAEALEVALSDGEEDALGFDALLEIWKGQVDLAPDEPLMLTGPVFFWEREHAGIRGAIGITTHNVVFLPSSGPGAERMPFQFSLMDVRPQNPDDPINIHMETPRGAMHFTALTGHGFCEAFWMLSGQLITQEITAEIEETRAGQALNRVLGDVMYLCLFSDEHNLATMRPAHTFEHEDGLGLLLSGCEGIELNRGQPLVVEFAQPEGTYQFDTEVLRMGPVPISLQNRFKNVHDMVLLKAPLDLRFNNRRSGYRVHGYDRVEVEGMLANDEGQEIATTCFLEDLSIGGCGVSSHDYIQEGARITLKLPLSEEREIHVQALCLRSEPPVDLGSPWQYGLEFADLSESNSDRINQELLRRQREELAEKTVDDEY